MTDETMAGLGQPDPSGQPSPGAAKDSATARAPLDGESSLTRDFGRAAAQAGAAGADAVARPVDPAGAVTSTGADPPVGAMRFRVLRPHAAGGLGQVSVAEDLELGRDVALKEIQESQADDPTSRSRFVLEAEITGRLEHPGIVPVYGLGHYADGRPYYAMRFIRGQSLKEAIEEVQRQGGAARSLAFRQLLGRFIDVCNTIQYAHDRGVLHRDLKPANIMLGKYGETLVVDWGLAKVMAQREAAAEHSVLLPHSVSDSAQTLPGMALGTPAFLSPEQAAGKLDEVGPSSDIYSLGATLYCVITGRGPMADDQPGNVVTMLERVQRGDFPRPRQVKPEVDPALEAIVLKAMALRPAERYASARKLADDVEQWLADEPVTAWTEPWTMRARRWIGRHRTLVTGVAAASVVGLVSMVLATVQLTSANRSLEQANLREIDARNAAVQATELAESRRRDAEAARKAAVEDAAAAMQMSNFMAGLFEQADPFVLGGHFLGEQPLVNPSALDIVERGAQRVGDRSFLREKPLVRAALLDKIGHVYLSLGEGAKAEPCVLEALELRQQNLRGDDDDLASSLHNVAFLHLTKGNLPKSAALFADALAMRSRLFGADSAKAVTTRFHLALALSFLEAELPRAEALLLEVLAIQRGRLDKAERDKSDQVGNEALECVCTLVVLCNVHQRRDQTAKAVPRFLEITQLLPRVANREFAAFLTSFMSFQQWKALRQPGLAEQSLRQALAALEKRVGKSHYLHMLLQRDLANFLFDNGRFDEAEKVLVELEGIYARNLGGDAAGVVSIYSLLANSMERGSVAKARDSGDAAAFDKQVARMQHYARAAFEHGKKCNIDWYRITMDGTYLAHTHLFVSGRPDLAEAERAARESWRLRKDHLGADHELCGHPFGYLLIALTRQDKSEELEKLLLELLSQAAVPGPGAGPNESLRDAAAKLAQSGRLDSAVLMLRLALANGTSRDQIRSNPAFEPLRKLPAYQQMMSQ